MNKKLLLVDDDIDDIESLTDIIFDISPTIKVSVAKNGNEMISLLESEKQLPDFIFLDLNMPIKTGFECLTEIRSNEKWKTIKIIILTTSSHREQINDVYKMGADLYIRKPNSYSAFKDILTKCLQMDWGFEKNINAFENKDHPINFFDSRLVYNDIVENIAFGIVVINFFKDGSFFISYTNKEFHKIASTYSEEIYNENNNYLFKSTHPDDLALVQAAVRQLFELKEFDIEFRMVVAGKIKNIRSQGKPIHNKSGNCITAYIYINDITEQVKNQISLKVSEEKYKFMFENAPHPMIMWEFETLNISDVNMKATELYGYTKEEFTKLNIRQIRPVEDIPLIEAATMNLESYGIESKRVWRHLKKSGELMYVEVSAHVFELNGKLVSINHNQDVTEKVKAEEDLKLMEFAFKKSSTPIMILLSTGDFYSFNDALLNLLGYTKDEFSKMNLLNVATTMDEAGCIKHWDEIREKKNIVFDCHFERKDGIMLDVEVSSNLINYNDNEVNFCYINNITEKKKVEAEINSVNELLLRQTNRLLLATKSAQLGIWDWDIAIDSMLWDEEMYKLYGISANEFKTINEGWTARLHVEDRTDVYNEIELALANKKEYNTEFRIVWSDSTIHYIRSTGFVERVDGKPKRMIGVSWDVTNDKSAALEKERMIKELLENNLDLKQFSYITTHNLRSPLTNLTLISKLISLQKIEDPSTLKLIEGFKLSTFQLNETLNDLLNVLIIKEKLNQTFDELSFEEILDKVKESISEILSDGNAIIETNFSEVPIVHFTGVYLESIFLNLITNSIKYRHPERNPIVKIKTIKDAFGRIILTFSDNGIGMDMSRVKQKIFGFHQRFHKNSDSKGIGLFLIKSQINALGGQIEVDSEMNFGTTFTITFNSPLK
jgi:PAS domain S-box-containing protein